MLLFGSKCATVFGEMLIRTSPILTQSLPQIQNLGKNHKKSLYNLLSKPFPILSFAHLFAHIWDNRDPFSISPTASYGERIPGWSWPTISGYVAAGGLGV